MARLLHYEPDHEGLAEYLLGPEVAELLESHAQGGAAYAQATGPRVTGEYVDSIHAEHPRVSGTGKDARQTAKIVADSDHAAAVEWGNVHVKPHHTLTHTIDVIQNS